MKLILTAVEESLADAWTKFCGDLDFITVHHGSIFDVDCDAVVSPTNSYGFMDGEIDGLFRSAIDDILLKKYRMPQSWAEASERHQLLYTNNLTRLQY